MDDDKNELKNLSRASFLNIRSWKSEIGLVYCDSRTVEEAFPFILLSH